MLQNKKFYPWLVVGLLVVVSLLNYLDRQMLATMRPYMMEDIPELESITNFGRLMAIFLWIYAFMSPISGVIADKMNRKWLIVISLFVWSFVTMCMGYTHNMNFLYVLRGIMGISEAFYIPAALSLVADYHQGKTRSIAIGVLTSGIYIGQAIGGFGATLSANVSWHFTFHLFGFIGISYSLVLIAFLREKKTYVVESTKSKGFRLNFKDMFGGMSILFTNIAFWVMLFYFAALNLPGWTTKNWLPTMISDSLHMSMEYAGPISTVTLALSSFVGVFLGGFISDKWVQKNIRGRIYTSSIGMSMIIPSLLLMVFGHSVVMIVASAIIFGLGFGMYDTNNMPIICQFIPSRFRATCYGIMNFVGIAAGALITDVLGKAFEANYTTLVFIVMVLTVAVSVFLQLRILRPKTIDMNDEMMGTNNEEGKKSEQKIIIENTQNLG